MNEVDIENKLRQIFVQVLDRNLQPADIPNEPGLLEHLLIDSLIALQIIVRIEQHFQVAIDDDDLAIQMLDSLEHAIAYIKQATVDHGALLPQNSPGFHSINSPQD